MSADYALWWIDGTPYAPMPAKLKTTLTSAIHTAASFPPIL